MKRHPPEEQISAWLDHQLDAAESWLIEDHLAGCAECTRIKEEMSVTTSVFRQMEVFDPPPHLWSRVVVSLNEAEPEVGRRFGALFMHSQWSGWLRPQIVALAATLIIGCGVGLIHWLTVRTERRQLAEIDRTYHILLPQNAESYNPFAVSPWTNADLNPFANNGNGAATRAYSGSPAKR